MERSRKVLLQEEDRLSGLPDPIICHILSFMPTKYAAKASILSRRWRSLLLDVPILLFDEEEDISQDNVFSDFVNRRFMLSQTHTSIFEFRLKLPSLPRICQVNSWVAALLKHNVKVMDIEEDPERLFPYTPDPHYLPRDLFRSVSLVELKLCVVDLVLKLPELVLLPNLKVLHLKHLEFQYESIYFRFDDRRFPLLEDLCLNNVTFRCGADDGNFFGLRIFSPTLKSLEIFVNDDPMIMSIDVDTPCLLHFDYEAFSQVKLCFSESVHLEKAYMYDHFNAGHDFHSRILRVVTNVEDLALTGFNNADLSYSLPQFPNLTHLSFIDTGYKSMWSMLQNAPNLEELQYRMSDNNNVVFVPPNDVPSCLAQSLTQIRLQNFAASEGYIEADIEFVKYALQHGKMLEKVTIEQPKDVGSKVFTELLMLPRCSAECVIQHKLEYESVEE